MATKAKMVFARAPSFRTVPANGIWGGITPDRSVVANFIVDYRKDPDSLTLEVIDNQAVESAREGENMGDVPIYVREAQVAVILSAAHAHAVGKWFLEKAREAGYVEDEGTH